MKKIIDKAMELCFPSEIYCIACENLIDSTRTYSICDRCIREIKWNIGSTCGQCGKAVADDYEDELCYDCQNANHVFRRGYSCVTYEGWGKKIVQNMKYKDRAFISEKIAEIMSDRNIDLFGALLIPVPMNIIKKSKRGFNQAELIAKALSKKTGILCETNVLKRSKASVAMSSLGREQRKLNFQNDFFVSDMEREKIIGKKIMLVDDVLTTGSTANACGEVLIRAGASSVDLFVFASGDNLNI